MLSIEKQLLYLMSRADRLEAQEFVRIYENRGYSAPYIRNSLSRLKKEGYAVTPSRSSYQITDTGRSMVKFINQKPQLYRKKWDQCWHLVMLEIPETERKKRDQFRSDILQTGFGLLYNSVYISPWPYKSEVEQLIQKYGLNGQVTLFQGSMQYRTLTPEDAISIWQLEPVAEKYREKLQWFSSQFEPVMQQALDKRSEPLEVFICYLHMGEVISELYLADPMLPAELLPEDWQGYAILQSFQTHLDKLAKAVSAGSVYAQFVRS